MDRSGHLRDRTPGPGTIGTVAAVAIVGALLFTYGEAYQHDIFGIRAYFWFIDYSEGFIRRGLVGELAAPFRRMAGSDAEFLAFVSGFYHTTAVLILLALFARCMILVRTVPARRFVLFACCALFAVAASPFVGNPAYNAGWLDIYMAGAASAAFMLTLGAHILPAAAIGAVMPLANEVFLFFWIPCGCLLALTWLRSPRSPATTFRLGLAALAPAFAVAGIALFESTTAPAVVIAGLPLDPSIKEILTDLTYTQTVTGQFLKQIDLYRGFAVNFLVSAIYTSSHVFIAVAALAYGLRPFELPAANRLELWLRRLLVVLVALGPALVLVIAWDVSRMFGWTGFSLLLFLGVVAAKPELFGLREIDWAEVVSRRAFGAPAAAMVLIGLFHLSTPLIYTYFQVAHLVAPPPAFPAVLQSNPVAQTSARIIAWYSRRWPDDAILKVPASLLCDLDTTNVEATGDPDTCAGALREGGVVFGPYAGLPEGRYAVTWDFDATAQCPGGEVLVDVVAGNDPLARSVIDIDHRRSVTLPIAVTPVQAVGKALQFRAYGRSGCALLKQVTVSAPDEDASG